MESDAYDGEIGCDRKTKRDQSEWPEALEAPEAAARCSRGHQQRDRSIFVPTAVQASRRLP